MADFNKLVDEVLLQLEGFAGEQAVVGTLAAALTSTASTFTVNGGTFADGMGFSPGTIELGEELIYAQAFDRTNGTFSGCLRGWRGTDAVAHAAGEVVRSSPTYPRTSVRSAIDDTLVNLPIFGVSTEWVNTSPGQSAVALPADVKRVLAVYISPRQSIGAWEPLAGWRVRGAPDSRYAPSAQWLDLPGVATENRQLQVTYAVEIQPIPSMTADLTETRCPEWAHDIVVLGTMWRLVSAFDLGRMSGVGVDQAVQANSFPPGQGQTQAKYLAAAFQTRVQEAVERQRKEFPVMVHWQGAL